MLGLFTSAISQTRAEHRLRFWTVGKEASDGPSTTKGGGDSCLDSGELAQLEISGEMVQLEMVKGSPPTVKAGLLE